MKKIIYITAVPQSLRGFVLPRVEWLKEEYEVVGISSPRAEVEELRAGGMRVIEVPIARRISP